MFMFYTQISLSQTSEMFERKNLGTQTQSCPREKKTPNKQFCKEKASGVHTEDHPSVKNKGKFCYTKTQWLVYWLELGNCCETCREPRKHKVISQNCKISISINTRHNNLRKWEYERKKMLQYWLAYFESKKLTVHNEMAREESA